MFLKSHSIKNCVKQFLLILLLLSSMAYCRKIEIDISKGYTDSIFEITDISYNSHPGIDTINFSNGLSLCTFFAGCCNAMFLCGTSGINILDTTALFYRSPDLNDTSWITAVAAPLNAEIGADTIYHCDSLIPYPSYILSHIEGDEMPEMLPGFKETPIFSKKILYGFSHGRYFKFQPESWILDTIHTALNSTQIAIKSMRITFASDSSGNRKFLMKTTEIKAGNQRPSFLHQLRNHKKLTRSGLLIQKSNAARLNLLGRNVCNPTVFP
jgi:hypothetical protein